jgi:hypothetical protein
MPASNATRARRGRAEREPSCGPSSPSPDRHRRTWSCRANGKLEEILHQVRGLILGVQESDWMIAPGWKCAAIQHSRGCDRNSRFFQLSRCAFLRSGMGDPYRVFRGGIVYVRLGAAGAPGQNASGAQRHPPWAASAVPRRRSLGDHADCRGSDRSLWDSPRGANRRRGGGLYPARVGEPPSHRAAWPCPRHLRGGRRNDGRGDERARHCGRTDERASDDVGLPRVVERRVRCGGGSRYVDARVWPDAAVGKHRRERGDPSAARGQWPIDAAWRRRARRAGLCRAAWNGAAPGRLLRRFIFG